MSKLFRDTENDNQEDELTINSSYANNYNNWRQKEELNKLKTKYGEHMQDIDSSSGESDSTSEDDEEGNQLTEEFERNFYKTLAYLKQKDSKIYDKNVVFFPSAQDDENFSDSSEESPTNDTKFLKKSKVKSKTTKEKPLFLRDYERKLLLEHDGIPSDDDDEAKQKSNARKKSLTYVEEQRALQESIKAAVKDYDVDNEDSGLLKLKDKNSEEKRKEEESYEEWLAGKTDNIDAEDKRELKGLRDFWSDPYLNENEKFLRDYVLNKKFLESENDDLNADDYQRLHDSDDNLSEDEKNIEKQEEFEHKYNFRFEEPDPEFIKRYPRTMDNTVRRKDTRRAQKRVELKKRKEEEKVRQKEELKALKTLKKREIMDKIAQLKEITGNDDMNITSLDIEGDFDPLEHDKKMLELFNDDYYRSSDENVKPVFPDLDEELEIEGNWDDFDPNAEKVDQGHADDRQEPHCEDTNFNMDADYNPTQQNCQDDDSIPMSRRRRRRKSRFVEKLSAKKPKFDPTVHSSFMDYFDEYYGLDYEDMIGDIPCRFKYRKVVPNDYGLSVEEILLAEDRELNRWCSLKKALEHKPENAEMRDVAIYKQKTKNEEYKRKILASLYKKDDDDNDDEDKIIDESKANNETNETKKKKKKRKNKKNMSENEQNSIEDIQCSELETKNVQNNGKIVVDESQNTETSEAIKENGKQKKGKRRNSNDNQQNNDAPVPPAKIQKIAKVGSKSNTKNNKLNKKSKIISKKKINDNSVASISDERFRAYGINPKKFKNKLKYGNKQTMQCRNN